MHAVLTSLVWMKRGQMTRTLPDTTARTPLPEPAAAHPAYAALTQMLSLRRTRSLRWCSAWLSQLLAGRVKP